METLVRSYAIAEITKTKSVVCAMMEDDALLAEVEAISSLLVSALERGRKVLLAGNGGSAADAQRW